MSLPCGVVRAADSSWRSLGAASDPERKPPGPIRPRFCRLLVGIVSGDFVNEEFKISRRDAFQAHKVRGDRTGEDMGVALLPSPMMASGGIFLPPTAAFPISRVAACRDFWLRRAGSSGHVALSDRIARSPPRSKWRAQISSGGRTIALGDYNSEARATLAGSSRLLLRC